MFLPRELLPGYSYCLFLSGTRLIFSRMKSKHLIGKRPSLFGSDIFAEKVKAGLVHADYSDSRKMVLPVTAETALDVPAGKNSYMDKGLNR